MIALVMAGGRGSRMGTMEKLLLVYKKPIISHVIEALRESGCFDGIISLTSGNAPRTEKLLHGMGVRTINSGGLGYSRDLADALKDMDGTVLVICGDLPLLDADMVRTLAGAGTGDRPWTAFVASSNYVESLGIGCEYTIHCEAGRCCYTGASLVDAAAVSAGMVDERLYMVNDRRLVFNVNTAREYGLLRSL